jgi:hypothetical protein
LLVIAGAQRSAFNHADTTEALRQAKADAIQ